MVRFDAALAIEYVHTPLRDQQVMALNKALTAEVLRHAQTRERLITTLKWCSLQTILAQVQDAPARKTRAEMSSAQRRAAERKTTAELLRTRIDLGQGVTFDPDAWRLISATGRLVKLSGNEGTLLRALVNRRGETVLYADLADAVWQIDMAPGEIMHALRVLGSRLRARLRMAGVVGLLTTVRWVGLRLEEPS
jgi:DNA-binding response OmpR family regulator